MKTTKTFAALTILVILTFGLASCSDATNSGNSSALANKSNAATVVNSSQTAVVNNSTATANAIASPTANIAANKSSANAAANKNSNAATSTGKFVGETISGELQVGKAESVILYVGMESGDYAAYCFPNDSDTGRQILAACKDKGQCQVQAVVGEGVCKVPGLEATLSASGRLTKVESVKAVGKK